MLIRIICILIPLFTFASCHSDPKPHEVAPSSKGQRENPFRVVHVGLEFPGALVGGVGEVAGALVKYEPLFGNQAQHRGITNTFMNASVVMPWYNIIVPDAADRFVMKVRHWFKGRIVESEVFQRRIGEATQYLVKPDRAYEKMFDIDNAKNIFSTVPNSKYIERATYFAGAATSFAAEFRDSTAKPFDIAHIHSMVLGMMPRIFSEVYVPKVARAKSTLPRTVFHLHSVFDAGDLLAHVSAEDCALLGLVRPRGTNAVEEAVGGVDHVIAASKWLATAALQHPKLGSYLEPSKVTGILNGIDYNAWKPSGLKGPTGEDLSFDETDVVEGKQKIKEYLSKKGYFADPDRPLIVFVGRFSREKGVGLLPVAALEAIKLGANVAILGTFAADPGPFKLIEDFKNREKDNKHLVVAMSLEAQKEQNFGKLVRGAADFVLVPSLSEGGGLAPREFMSSGSLAISSGVEGLAEQMRDIREVQNPLREGNAFVYGDKDNTRIEDMKSAIREAIGFMQRQSASDRNTMLARIMREAEGYDWMAPGGAIEQTVKVYRAVLK